MLHSFHFKDEEIKTQEGNAFLALGLVRDEGGKTEET